MTADQAKGHLLKGVDEPAVGYITPEDIGDALDQVYADMGPAPYTVRQAVASLPTAGNTPGDVRMTTADRHLHIWDGTAWTDTGALAVTGGSGVTVKGTVDGTNPLPAVPAAGDMYIAGSSTPAGGWPSGTNPVAGGGLVWDGARWHDVGPVRGPQGPKGDQGIQGPKGDAGDTLPAHTAADAQKSLRVKTDGTLAWEFPVPIVVKATQPTASDYDAPAIPTNAVWLKKV